MKEKEARSKFRQVCVCTCLYNCRQYFCRMTVTLC